MILWINGAFGSGKTTAAYELRRRTNNSFVYDPENVGYFIWKNAPPKFKKGDFQDIPLWREMNYHMLRLIASGFGGLLIVPMTLVNKDYYDEIITKLANDGLDIRHFILYASKATILKRLKKRSVGKPDAFAMQSIDGCLHAFDTRITDIKIMTDDMSIDGVVAEIAEQCGIVLNPDKRPRIKRLFDRFATWIKHIR